jgi:hypothetical protein
MGEQNAWVSFQVFDALAPAEDLQQQPQLQC